MLYLSQMLGKPVVDATGENIGTINDIAIATGEVFPRVTSLAFKGPDKIPFMLSWRKFVSNFDGERIALNVAAADIRFSYLQPDEVLLSRDLMSKQIVDTQGMKVVRVNDLKLSESRNQLRLLGAEVGARGILRGISPGFERFVARITRVFGHELEENIIAWNYMDLLDRDLSQVKLSVTHKRLHELHPADVADILEKLAPAQRARVFEHLDNEQAADTISELEDELQADVIDDLSERRASDLLAEMDPDDAADIIGDLPYDKAETLLRLMGVKESSVIRSLLGYKDKTAGGIMTPEVTTVAEDMTVERVIDHIRAESAEHESVYYIYVVEGDQHLVGAVSLRDLLLALPGTPIGEIAERDLFVAHVDDDQEDVAEQMSKYDLLAMPVTDENGKLLGVVTVDDALDVLEEEADEDFALATGSTDDPSASLGLARWFIRRNWWIVVWALTGIAVYSLAPKIPWLGQNAVLLLPALALLPVVLRIAEDTTTRAIGEIIEESEAEKPMGVWTQIARDGLLGLVAGVLLGLIVFALAEVLFGSAALAAAFAVATGLTVMLELLAGVGVTVVARRRVENDKHLQVRGSRSGSWFCPRSPTCCLRSRAARSSPRYQERRYVPAADTTKSRTKWRLVPLLAALGPGIIAASAGNDAGGIATYSAAGASYGYATLWMILVMTFSLVVVQEMAARMGAVTGKGFAALIRERFGIRPTIFAMACLLTSNAATSVAEFAGIAASLQLFGVSKFISVPIAAAVVWLLVVRGSYRNVERMLLVLSSVFLAYVAAAFMAKPDWAEVLKATVVPTFIPTAGFVLIVIATIGTTIAPWMQFFVQSNIVDKGVTAKELGYQRVDVVGGAISANIIAWFIIVTTGTVLYPRNIPAASAQQAALALAPVAGQYATILFAVGLFGASLLAAFVLPLTAAYAVTEAFGFERGIDRTWAEAPVFVGIYTFVIVFGAAFVLIPSAPLITIMVMSQAVNGVLLPFLLIFMMIIINDGRIMGRYTNGPAYNFVGWTTVTVVIGLTVALLGFMAVGAA